MGKPFRVARRYCTRHPHSSREGVLLTSSTAAVYATYGSKSPKHVYTAEDWSNVDVLTKKTNWYALSKTQAEQVAWDISAREGCPFELTVMCPTLILGPML